MSALRTRRAALRAGAAAISALCAPAVALVLPLPAADLDAELFALLDRYRDLNAGMDVASADFYAAHDRAKAAYPARPAELRSGFGDRCFDLGASATGWEEGADGLGWCFFEPLDVHGLRAAGPVRRWAVTQSDEEKPRREPDPEGEARRLEIIAADDRSLAERKAVRDAVGCSTAERATEAAVDALNAAERAVSLCLARTLPGLVAKGAWVADLLARDAADDDLAEVFARQVAAFGGVAA